MDKTSSVILPFLKWAGGKRWLVDNNCDLIPRDCERYIEPFLGGGSVFFHLQPNRAILADMNEALIETYAQIRDDTENLIDKLHEHQRKHSKEYYYEVRSKKYVSPTDRAAQFLYLNRTCWNGLYRVNLKGVFNVPIGTKSTVVLKTDDFHSVAEALKNSKLLVQDFEKTMAGAREGDFVYVDPPYTVNHKNNGFIKYNEKIFSWDDQIRLRDCVVDTIDRGAKVIVSNADHESLRDLYANVGNMKTLQRSSVIAGKSSKRGRVDEMLITSW
ncbi:MAG: Dam family site-specific DNA-(adenine-N6)-methyltransferase [Mariprofundaceae bacterium]|nr:Dam family site-specific DNA-(adenine-N6)-methyltransferase [Mariprofundaceae bacterium]